MDVHGGHIAGFGLLGLHRQRVVVRMYGWQGEVQAVQIDG